MENIFEKILCEDESVFDDALSGICDNTNENINFVDEFLRGSEKCLVVEGTKGTGKSFDVKSAILNNVNNFSRVYYLEYDKEKYLNIGKTRVFSIDNILKKTIYRLLWLKGICEVSDDALQKFENALDENTLLVIDNYDIPSFSPYLRHLLTFDCRMIVVTRAKSTTIEKDCVCKTTDVSQEIFFNKLCEKLQNRYCLYYKITQQDFCDKISLINIKDSPDGVDNFLLKYHAMCCFDEKENELLRTLCAMLFYLMPSTEITSSKSGVFDVNSVKYYLGNLAFGLEKLINLGFVNVCRNGRLYFDRAVMEFVLKYQKPDSSNCKTFMEFVLRVSSFTVVQDVKNTDAVLYTYDKKDYAELLNEEFFDVYTHYLTCDKNRFYVVYNVLICALLEKYKDCGYFKYINHLLWHNKNAYVAVLYDAMNDEEFCRTLYDFEQREDLYAGVYTDYVFSRLDLLRVCSGLLNKMPKFLYHEAEICFDIIYESLNEIIDVSYIKSVLLDDKIALLDDAIRLVYELFAYCCVFDIDMCVYHKMRSLSSSFPVMYGSLPEIDNIKAVSICMPYSVKTVKLYGVFQKLLYEYKRSTDVADLSQYNVFFKSLLEKKKDAINKAINDISLEYSRIISGYDKFYDFYDKKHNLVKIWQHEISDEELQEKLNDCKRLSKRGFDSATKTGGERYAKDVLCSLSQSQNTTFLAAIVLSTDFEIGSNTYNALQKNDFALKLYSCNNISTQEKVFLIEYCLENICGVNEIDELFDLRMSVINKLISYPGFNDAAKKRICESMCYAYIKAKSCKNRHENRVSEFFNLHFDEKCLVKESAVCCFAYAYKCQCENKQSGYIKNDVFEASRTIAFENLHNSRDFSVEGFIGLVEDVCGKNSAQEICSQTDGCKREI